MIGYEEEKGIGSTIVFDIFAQFMLNQSFMKETNVTSQVMY